MQNIVCLTWHLFIYVHAIYVCFYGKDIEEGVDKKKWMDAPSLKKVTSCDGNCLYKLDLHSFWSCTCLATWPPGGYSEPSFYHLESKEFLFVSLPIETLSSYLGSTEHCKIIFRPCVLMSTLIAAGSALWVRWPSGAHSCFLKNSDKHPEPCGKCYFQIK